MRYGGDVMMLHVAMWGDRALVDIQPKIKYIGADPDEFFRVMFFPKRGSFFFIFRDSSMVEHAAVGPA
jgi:hypothetical protein